MKAHVAPGLDPHPLLGHVPAFHRDRLELLDACAAAPGPVVRLRIGRPALLLKRAEDIQHVIVERHASYPKGSRNAGPRAQRIFGTGLMTTNAEAHREMRVRVQPLFRRDPVSRLDTGIVRCVDRMLDRWTECDEIDLADEMNRLSLETLVVAIFGEESERRRAAIEDGMIARRHSMGRAFAWPVTAPRFLPIAVRPRGRQAIRRLDDTIDALIRERATAHGDGDDLLSMMLGRWAASEPVAGAREIRNQTLNLVLAAHGNVARALTYTALAIARHPDVEERVRAEVDALPVAGAPTTAGTAELRYLGLTIAESMRLWPPSALLFRTAREHDVLPSGARVRPGWKVLVSPYVVQRDPAYYPDPERFDPERHTPEARAGRPKYAYFPFGGGPRVCIGQTLSSTICALALTRMTQRARLELGGEPPAYACGCLGAGYGPRMRVQARFPAAITSASL